jgi:hypothetical protein
MEWHVPTAAQMSDRPTPTTERSADHRRARLGVTAV